MSLDRLRMPFEASCSVGMLNIVMMHALQGARAPPKYLEAAERAAALLAKYEGAASPPMVVRDGEACAMLHCWEGSAVEREMQAPVCGCEVKAYNYDFQVCCRYPTSLHACMLTQVFCLVCSTQLTCGMPYCRPTWRQ